MNFYKGIFQSTFELLLVPTIPFHLHSHHFAFPKRINEHRKLIFRHRTGSTLKVQLIQFSNSSPAWPFSNDFFYKRTLCKDAVEMHNCTLAPWSPKQIFRKSKISMTKIIVARMWPLNFKRNFLKDSIKMKN